LTRKSGKYLTGIRCLRMLIRSRSSGGVGAGSIKLEHRQFFVFEFSFVFGSWVARRKYNLILRLRDSRCIRVLDDVRGLLEWTNTPHCVVLGAQDQDGLLDIAAIDVLTTWRSESWMGALLTIAYLFTFTTSSFLLHWGCFFLRVVARFGHHRQPLSPLQPTLPF
jgi:hypothetical protein